MTHTYPKLGKAPPSLDSKNHRNQRNHSRFPVELWDTQMTRYQLAVISMVFIILPAILVKTRSKDIYIYQGSIYWGAGKLPPKSFPEKKFKLLFQILILFDDDIKESVNATNVQKCNFGQS